MKNQSGIKDLLRKSDAVAKKRGMSRSPFLVDAAQQAMQPTQNRQPLP
jgi:metal-responsive CopG/Arc/MetJ family transcriptional regulator